MNPTVTQILIQGPGWTRQCSQKTKPGKPYVIPLQPDEYEIILKGVSHRIIFCVFCEKMKSLDHFPRFTIKKEEDFNYNIEGMCFDCLRVPLSSPPSL